MAKKQITDELRSEKEKALNAALADIEKTFGKGAIMKMDGTQSDMDLSVISTGSLSLDKALGVGGLPMGRIVEIFGPESSGKTTLTLEVIAQAQKKGLTCFFLDAENAFDSTYAKNLGVDVEKLYVSQPDSGEQGLEIVDTMVNSGAIDVIIVDSVAALTPKAELEGDMGDSHVGLQARMMSQALRKITASVKRNNVLVIFINQIRMKIGVMFGCLSHDTLIPLTDGRSFPIGELVKKRIEGSVWSYNEKTKKIEEKKIVDWHDNGMARSSQDFLVLDVSENIKEEGFDYQVTLTQNHEILVKDKSQNKEVWKQAKDLKVGDKVINKSSTFINHELYQFILGLLLSGSAFIFNNKYTNRYDLRLKLHKEDNLDRCNALTSIETWVDWKAKKLSPLSLIKMKDGGYINEVHFPEFAYMNKNQHKVETYFKDDKISDLTLAVWLMENGYLLHENNHYSLILEPKNSFRSFSEYKYLSHVLENSNFPNKLVKIFDDDGKGELAIEFTNSRALKACLRYIDWTFVKIMFKPEKFFKKEEYLAELKEKNIADKDLFCRVYTKSHECEIKAISPMKNKDFFKHSGKYDISVEDNHNYLAGGKYNGFIVHNSPETTTGGNALKFYSSVRLDIRGNTVIKGKNEDEPIGKETKVKVIKNKVAPPFRTAEFDIIYGKGINRTAEILQFACDMGLMEKTGAWYKHNGQNIAQGKENAIEWLNNHEDIREQLYDAIINNK